MQNVMQKVEITMRKYHLLGTWNCKTGIFSSQNLWSKIKALTGSEWEKDNWELIVVNI